MKKLSIGKKYLLIKQKNNLSIDKKNLPNGKKIKAQI